MNLIELASVDLKKIPTEILREMFCSLQKELSFRRACVTASDRKIMAARDDKFHKLPNEKFVHNRHHLKFLDELANQDWTHIFNGGDSERRYYVYAHFAPKTKAIKHQGVLSLDLPGTPFYIGKGTGKRAYDLKRNQGHGIEISQLIAQGHKPNEIVCIINDGLTEAKAFEIESKLIYFFGTKFERHRRGLLVNLEIPATPFN